MSASTVSLPTVARDTRASTFGHEIPETEFPSDFLQLAAIFSWKRKSRFINAGFNEVVVNEATVETLAKRRISAPDRPLIRISSTFFWRLSSDYDLAPSNFAGACKGLRD
ncbi:hypothetical protein PAXINDRAFT_102790 [Paxillus involutus ATCC 200175]|uniref:Uncharacterized protein n=1 Tax=Paxillus involutus ATCC 200175 TaxID=664439 RepID=A0A0C9SNF4_PAXIN|nr:hypothetical protein PAXINDRAFT_102790 [Paxillus involutus ATCC 200175]